MSLHCVYVHTFPNGKTYVGQALSGETEKRWCKGRGYSQQRVFREIVKFGWDNVKHEVIEDGIPDDEINEKERSYIKQFRSDNPKYGFNAHIGLGASKNKSRKYDAIALKKTNELHDRLALCGISDTEVANWLECTSQNTSRHFREATFSYRQILIIEDMLLKAEREASNE